MQTVMSLEVSNKLMSMLIPGFLAAAFQSCMYGAFTPAGGIFAILTSMGMMGTWMLPVVLVASVYATCVALSVWALQH